MRVLAYKFGSKSARALAQALETRVVKHDGNFRNNYNHPIINWGTSKLPVFPVNRWINHPNAVANASNKLRAFRLLQEAGVTIPEFTTDRDEAQRRVLDDSEAWVARRKLTGHSGEGIVIAVPDSPPELRTLPNAPLYVKYIKKMHEYRFHVINGRVVDVQQKRKRRQVDNEEVDYKVRNLSTGWVYTREDVHFHDSLPQLAIDAIKALGLDFGAVDIIWNEHHQQGYVLEVNTACGLEGQTVQTYATAIQEMLL